MNTSALKLCMALAAGILMMPDRVRADELQHADDDAFWADVAKVAVAFQAPPQDPPSPEECQSLGQWGPVIQWPHVPVSAANLPDGRIVTFASNERRTFPSWVEFTYAATFDPATGQVVENNHLQHDMFCGGMTMLEDGRVMVTGGRNTVKLVSTYDHASDEWTLEPERLVLGRWYSTTVLLGDGRVVVTSGSGGQNAAERWTDGTGWELLNNVDWTPIANATGFESHWWPYTFLAPNGKLAHVGPTDQMHWFDPNGQGSVQTVNATVPATHYPKHAALAMYDVGKVLIAGGAPDHGGGSTVDRAYTVDINGTEPVVTPIASMNHRRRFANAIVLPSGEVIVVGGNDSGAKFSDVGAKLAPEIWNPDTGLWREVAAMSVPRNYHSVALLLPDGRVYAGGGGLHGGEADHLDAQIFTPPCLFNPDGSLADRPEISSAPDTMRHGVNYTVNATQGLWKFSLIKMMAVTHGISIDQRYVSVPFNEVQPGVYELDPDVNPSVLPPGYWMLFALNDQGVHSVSKIVRVARDGRPVLANPGNQLNQAGDAVSLGLTGSDPEGDALSWSAVNLPTGLSLDSNNGLISGTLSAPGFHTVTATLTDLAGLSDVITFNWQILGGPHPPGDGLVGEYRSGENFGPLILTRTDPVIDFDWGDGSPDPQVPTNQFSVRWTGWIMPEYSGLYTFFTRSDDGSMLYIDDQLVVNNWGHHAPKQVSGTFNLVAGQPLPIRIDYFESGGGSVMEASWAGPDAPREAIPQNVLYTTLPVQPNQPPVLAAFASQLSVVGAAVSLGVNASDPDGNVLIYSVANLPPGLSISATDGAITGAPTTAGNYAVTVMASDGQGEADSQSFQWTVNPALSLQPITSPPIAAGATVSYTAVATGGANPLFAWNFGDGSVTSGNLNTPTVSHTFSNPGRFIVTLTATDDTGTTKSTTFNQAVHGPLSATRPVTSMTVIYEKREGNDRVWNVNPDNNTASAFDTATDAKLTELSVGTTPRSLAIAPNGEIWVANKGSANISVINPDTLAVTRTITLPGASQPAGIAFAPDGNHCYVTLEATGKLLRLDPTTGATTGSVDVGSRPRHLSITADSGQVLVSRFISPPVPGESTAAPQVSGSGGEVLIVDATSLSVDKTVLLRHSDRPNASASARGIPNYLGPAAISPDGTMAWVPSKQDNIELGAGRNGQGLNHDNTLRSIASQISLATETENHAARIDFDNFGIPSTALFGRYGNYLFVAGEASQEIVIVDPYGAAEIHRFAVQRAPQGLAISPDGLRLYVHNFLSRSISVVNLDGVVLEGKRTPSIVATYPTVANESLSPPVLLGKQHFYDARDIKLALEQYISCASCHNDGDHDGRIWDLTGFGEGLRNTISLVGHGGPAHGRLHWSANFDEVHDFEGQIRGLSSGLGLMTDAQFNTGTRSQSLGDPKAGVSADLDALAAYVNSLTTFDTSPDRNGEILTADAIAGKARFDALNCAACHGGGAFTDSASGAMHDIGTIKPNTGQRLNGPLTGLDTPTLRGIWNTAPHLHDGSAATLADAINAHAGISLTGTELDQLVAYLRQIDGNEPGIDLNIPPSLAPVANQSGSVNTAASLQLSATDPNNDSLTFGAAGLPAGLNLNPVTGHIAGTTTTPTTNQVTVTVTVADGRGGSGSQQFTWSVQATQGAQNIILSHGFETGQSSWGADGASQIVQDPNQAQDGQYFLRIPAAASTVVRYFNVPNANWQTGGTYLLEFYARISPGAKGSAEAGFTFFDAGYNEIANFAPGVEVIDSVWTKYTVGPITAPTTAAHLEFWALKSADSGFADFDVFRWIDNTTATPAPTAILTTPASTVSGPFGVNVTFSETVSGLSGFDFAIGNGESMALSGSGNQYTLQVDPLGNPVTVTLPAGKVQSVSGLGNQASSTLTVLFTPPSADDAYQHGFEAGQPAWGTDGNAIVIDNSGSAAQGQRFLQIQANGGNTSVGYHEIPTTAWATGETYRLEFKARLGSGATGSAVAGLTFFDQNYNEIANAVVSKSVTGSQWQTWQTDPVVVPANASHAELWALKGAGNATAEFDDFRLLGTQPTAPSTPPAGGTNLLKNGGFETLKADWNESGDGPQITAIVTGNQHAGARALSIPNAGGGADQLLNIDASKNYRVRLWGYHESAAGWMGYGTTFYNNSGDEIAAQNTEKEITATSWQESILTVNPPDTAVEMTVWIWKDGGQGQGFIDEVTVEVAE